MNPCHLFCLIVVLTLVKHTDAQTSKNALADFVIPRYFVANSDCYIYGPFDGDGSNTVICFENNQTLSFSVKPTIEGSDKILIKVPNTHGEFELIIVDEGNNKELFTPVRVVQLRQDLDITRARLKKPFPFFIRLLGAEKSENEFSFTLENRTPHIVSLIGGNRQKHKIKSTKESTDVFWEGKLVAIDPSEFLIMTGLEQPPPSIRVAPY
ncbi:hypothetical protein [uncultured Sunxiuqinia sp.]|jgi:hypothetical protein|uniref:hypothetical protein n=1 Tax=uncultured Sunxiuqinia sp. TaxID=1573825 RepID=UPI0030D93CD4|tara:strand:+ start:5919 stop:6548 length:630 start_codon:yes stop_codon:yes gene_type:complete